MDRTGGRGGLGRQERNSGPYEGDPRSAPGMRRAPCRRPNATAAELNLWTIFPRRHGITNPSDRTLAFVSDTAARQNYVLGEPNIGEGILRGDEGTRTLSGNYTQRSHVTTTNRRISLPACLFVPLPDMLSLQHIVNLASCGGESTSAGC